MCTCLVSRLCLALYHPLDCSPTRSSVHGIFRARILGWFAISFSRGSPQARNGTSTSCVSCRQILYQLSHPGSLYIYTKESEIRSVVSDSLQPPGLYPTRLLCSWNSLGQNTGMGSLSLLRESFQSRGRTQVSCTAGGFFTI